MTTKKQIPALLMAQRQPTASELTQDIAQPAEPAMPVQATGSVRSAVDSGYSLEYNPSRALAILKGMQSGQNLQEGVRLGLTVLRRNAKLRSVMTNRVLAVTSLSKVLESGGTSRKAKQAAQACQALIATPHFKKLVRHLAWASYFGWSGAQVIYGKGSTFWPVSDFKTMPADWFVFDPADGETPMLLPAQPGVKPAYLEPYGKFVFHTPQLLPGAPYLNGIMYTAVFYAVLTQIVLKQGTSFIELYNQAMRLGYYEKGDSKQHKADREILKKALQNLGSDSWAMIPKEMQIEFVKDATAAQSVDNYEKWARYFDELLTQLANGASLTSGTGNTGSGGSQALGTVHADMFERNVVAEADDLADTIVRDVLTPFVRFNFGEDVEIPFFRFQVEKTEDLEAKMRATKTYFDMGGTVSSDELRQYLGWRAPEASEATLGAAATQTTSEDANAALSARFAAEGETSASGDELDALIAEYQATDGYQVADAAINEKLLEVIAAADPAKLVEALEAFVRKAGTQDMNEALAGAILSATAAGELGANIGGA